MPIISTDLVEYASVNMPSIDSGTNGGAIDLKRRVDFTQIAANDDVEVISTSASDTQNCTIRARAADGSITSQTAALTGTTAKIFNTLGAAGVIERVISVDLASDAIGTITVRRSVAGATVRVIPIGERGFMMLFRECASDPSAQKDYYTKTFLKNTHATLALQAAIVKQNADPDARITHTLADAVNDSTTSTNRVTAPVAGDIEPDTFADTDVTLLTATGTADLAATVAIGVWRKLTLPAADPPHRSTYTIELSGQSV
jgi:hypothetical protein